MKSPLQDSFPSSTILNNSGVTIGDNTDIPFIEYPDNPFLAYNFKLEGSSSQRNPTKEKVNEP